MQEKSVWMMSGDNARQVSSNFKVFEKLPIGIYNIDLVPFTGWVLEKYADKFEFDYKLYDLQSDFIKYVCKTFNSTNGNLGILLNGTKGTGKTVTAKELANALNLPVIIVKSFGDKNQDLIEFLSTINCDCILFFDEFEKNFSEKDSTILQIMDGVYNSGYRKVFLLTTNTMNINDNLIGRPSRIRYVKTFKNLELKTVKAYLNDNLKDKTCYSEVIEYIDSLTISTIDILKSIVNEINIHGIDEFRHSRSFFNVKSIEYNYQILVSDLPIMKFESDMVSKNPIYSVKTFLELVKAKKIFDEGRLYRYNLTQEEFDKLNNDFSEARKQNPFGGNICGRTFTSTEKFSSLRVGSVTEWGTVVKIDHDNSVIITKDMDAEYDDNSIHFIYFVNPNAKPSLYNNTYKKMY